MEWGRPSMDTSAPGQNATRAIIDRWNLLNKMDSFVAHMHDLYPNNILMSMVACAKEYPIPFPNYMDKKSYQRVAEDGMYIRNHDFDETAELVWLNF